MIYTRILQIRNMMTANQNIKSGQISVTPRGVKRQMTKDNSIKYLGNPFKAHYDPGPPYHLSPWLMMTWLKSFLIPQAAIHRERMSDESRHSAESG